MFEIRVVTQFESEGFYVVTSTTGGLPILKCDHYVEMSPLVDMTQLHSVIIASQYFNWDITEIRFFKS